MLVAAHNVVCYQTPHHLISLAVLSIVFCADVVTIADTFDKSKT